MIDLEAMYQNWGNHDWAADVEAVTILYEHLQGARNVLECGSGWTSVVIALSKKPYLVLENDRAWAERAQLAIIAAGEYPNVALCPLSEQHGCLWFTEPPLQGPYDLVFSDGPPDIAFGKPQNRYALLPILQDHLTDDAVILLHNADREGEQAVIRRWQEERPGTTCEMVGEFTGKVRLGHR